MQGSARASTDRHYRSRPTDLAGRRKYVGYHHTWQCAIYSQHFLSIQHHSIMSIKVGINGFGRIGRLVMRAAKNFPNVQVRCIFSLRLSFESQLPDAYLRKSLLIRKTFLRIDESKSTTCTSLCLNLYRVAICLFGCSFSCWIEVFPY